MIAASLETTTSLKFSEELLMKSLYKLSEDLTKFFEKSEECDVKIEIGKYPDVKRFTAHSPILRARSSYFYKALSKQLDNNKNDDSLSTTLFTYNNGVFVLEKENVSPKNFEIILDFMYSGIGEIAKLNKLSSSEFLVLFETCGELGVYGYEEYLQHYFLQNHDKWIRQNLLDTEKFTAKHKTLDKIRNYCLDQFCQNPDPVFKPIDIKSIKKDVLRDLLSRDDLIVSETDRWNFIIEWGIAQDPYICNEKTNVSEWSEEEFSKLKTIMGDLISLIRFNRIASDFFYKQVRPYKMLFDRDTYEDVMQSYLVSPISPISPISPSTKTNPTDISVTSSSLQKESKAKKSNSNLMSSDYANLFSCWIDKKPYSPDYRTYKFKLVYRGSSENFSPSAFHKKCDYTSNTLTIVRIQDTKELIGGYNPRGWKIAGCNPDENYSMTSKRSFLFKIDKDDIKNSMISRVVDNQNALRHRNDSGPNFMDLSIFDRTIRYNNRFYDKDLEIKNRILLDDYEVYSIIPIDKK